MPSFDFRVEILDNPGYSLDQRKIGVIENLAQGFSNRSISDELGISIKSVERILSELNRKFNSHDYDPKTFQNFFNPRLRLLVSLVSSEILEYSTVTKPRLITGLNESFTQTLVLSSIGLSNRKIAELFDITEKAIELRFSQLFDSFNIDTKSLEFENPRVSLFISAYCRDNLKKSQLKRLYRETQLDRLAEIFNKPEAFLSTLEQDYKYIG